MPDSPHHDTARRDFAPNGLLLVAGRLWDGTGAGARRDMALVIRDGRVERVAPAAECAGWHGPRLHAGGATVMPGLMDLHVHLVSVVDPDEHVSVAETRRWWPSAAVAAGSVRRAAGGA